MTSSLQDDLDHYPVAASDGALGQVPVIDLSAVLESSTSAAAQSAVDAIARACRDWGFFQIVNHGVPAQLIDATWRETRAFFARPAAYKESLLRTRENPWGYYNNELTKNQRDRKEVFDYTVEGVDPIYGAENRWPPADEAFRASLISYRNALVRLSLALLEAFCVGLGLPRDFMHANFATNHTGFVRLNYYPVMDPLEHSNIAHLPVADLGVHHHTDAGALTVLMQDDVGGLQVFRDGYWHNIRPVANAFVINTGDMMQVWSNDIYQAAIHRVLAMNSRDRYSIPFFFNPSAGTVVSPLPGTVSTERPARYRPIGWAEFRGKRTDGDYADYGPEVQISHYRICKN